MYTQNGIGEINCPRTTVVADEQTKLEKKAELALQREERAREREEHACEREDRILEREQCEKEAQREHEIKMAEANVKKC